MGSGWQSLFVAQITYLTPITILEDDVCGPGFSVGGNTGKFWEQEFWVGKNRRKGLEPGFYFWVGKNKGKY